jgi:hypothetical protein
MSGMDDNGPEAFAAEDISRGDMVTVEHGEQGTVVRRWSATPRVGLTPGENTVYEWGGNDVTADWITALQDLVPDDVDPSAPSQVAAYIERIQGPRRPSHDGWPDDSGAHAFVSYPKHPRRCGVEHPTERDEHGRPTLCLDREETHWVEGTR